ncbi:MAG TPA: FG-GAP-like repeat-containing protein, partial [Methylotenera sp.]|nr:FG-GAP-like repeat-containing protein [Methylotenera sp.]
MALGDLDADGDLDAVVANNGPQDVVLNDGTGNFSPHPTTPTFGAGNSQAVALADVDGDEDLDAVIANRFGVAQDVYLNDGGGNFSLGSTFGNGETYGIALGDIDNDGDLDAVVANRTNVPTLPANQQVFLNNGSGLFTLHPTTPTFSTNDSRSVALGDVDNDGDLDAAIGNFSNQPEAVYLNDGAGNFGAGTTFGGGFTGVVALADVDGINPNSLTVTTAPNSGTAQVNPQTGEIIYTPNAGFTGIDTFVYQADSGTATVSVTVGNAVLPTIAFSQPSYSVQEDGTVISAITLTRSGDLTTASSVNILPSNGTATGGATLGVGVDFQNTAI